MIPWGRPQEEVFARISELNEAEERTKWTEAAHERFLALAREQFGDVRIVEKGGMLVLFLDGYVAEVRGQSFAAWSGATGFARSHLIELRDEVEPRVPAYLVFAQGKTCWTGFLRTLGEPRCISRSAHGPSEDEEWDGRYGWTVAQLGGGRPVASFRFPGASEIPPTPDLADRGVLFA